MQSVPPSSLACAKNVLEDKWPNMRDVVLAQVESEFNMTADGYGLVKFSPSALG
jgi:hypothetical protein